MKQLIGLAGRARVGKDTVADMLSPFGYKKVSFADPIRAAVAEIFSVSRHIIYADGMKTLPIMPGRFSDHITPRFLMQTLGTEWGRNLIDEDIWLKLVQSKWDVLDSNMVVADVRFENEARWIRETGGKVWHIRRDVTVEVGGVAGHARESGVMFYPGIDELIENNGSVHDLLEKVVNALGVKAMLKL